jgi:hypothetical protein
MSNKAKPSAPLEENTHDLTVLEEIRMTWQEMRREKWPDEMWDIYADEIWNLDRLLGEDSQP